MSEQYTILNRLGRFFKRSGRSSDEALVSREITPTNGSLIRPWGRNQAAISQLQEGFQSLTDLMNTIRLSMEAQGKRQDELLEHLSALPRVLDTLPESNRVQSEMLKAIQDQLTHQAVQQTTLGEILVKLSDAGGDQKDILQGLRERVETLNQQDRAMADSLNTVGAAMESASRNSAASAQVLEQLGQHLRQRDGDLEIAVRQQGSRFTLMLAIAIFMSIGALVAVVGMGFLMIHGGR